MYAQLLNMPLPNRLENFPQRCPGATFAGFGGPSSQQASMDSCDGNGGGSSPASATNCIGKARLRISIMLCGQARQGPSNVYLLRVKP